MSTIAGTQMAAIPKKHVKEGIAVISHFDCVQRWMGKGMPVDDIDEMEVQHVMNRGATRPNYQKFCRSLVIKYGYNERELVSLLLHSMAQ